MSLQPSPSLADKLASLRSTAPAGAGRRMLPKSLDALIAAIFARIFARLEQIFLLWQSGTLPMPAPRERATHPQPKQFPQSHAARRTSASAWRLGGQSSHASAPSPSPCSTRGARAKSPAPRPCRGTSASHPESQRPRSRNPAARDPPAHPFSIFDPSAKLR